MAGLAVDEEPLQGAEQALRALDFGIELAEELAADGVGLIALGDMGIGNTAISSAVTAALSGCDPVAVVGRGTGVDDEGLRIKLAAVRRALQANATDPKDPVGVLAAVGGFELGVLAGLALGAAASGVIAFPVTPFKPDLLGRKRSFGTAHDVPLWFWKDARANQRALVRLKSIGGAIGMQLAFPRKTAPAAPKRRNDRLCRACCNE